MVAKKNPMVAIIFIGINNAKNICMLQKMTPTSKLGGLLKLEYKNYFSIVLVL